MADPSDHALWTAPHPDPVTRRGPGRLISLTLTDPGGMGVILASLRSYVFFPVLALSASMPFACGFTAPPAGGSVYFNTRWAWPVGGSDLTHLCLNFKKYRRMGHIFLKRVAV